MIKWKCARCDEWCCDKDDASDLDVLQAEIERLRGIEDRYDADRVVLRERLTRAEAVIDGIRKLPRFISGMVYDPIADALVKARDIDAILDAYDKENKKD